MFWKKKDPEVQAEKENIDNEKAPEKQPEKKKPGKKVEAAEELVDVDPFISS